MKLKRDPITAVELSQYLEDASDFAFELRILQMLTMRDIPCEHGGLYRDPGSGKFREFDLRVRLTRGQVTLAAAIECKAIGAHFPLLVSCVPRSQGEAEHQILIHKKREKRQPEFYMMPSLDVGEAKLGQSIKQSALYPAGEPVGKSTAQVGIRDTASAELGVNDAEFFEKWTQALQSLDDMVADIASENYIAKLWNGQGHWAMALPIVVVPDGRLWMAQYTADGSLERPPRQTDRIPVYVKRSYSDTGLPGHELEVSHLEVMTETGLRDFCDRYLADVEGLCRLTLPDR